MNFVKGKEAENNGRPTEFNFTQVWQLQLSKVGITLTFFIDRSRRASGYFELLPNDMIRLTERGRRYCRDLERQ